MINLSRLERIVFVLSFIIIGCLPIAFGFYSVFWGNYLVSAGCLITAACGFFQIYYNLKSLDLLSENKQALIKKNKELMKSTKTLEQRNKEIWNLKDYNYD